jgi:hypothetical protein
MSAIKNPKTKKQWSLERDRRNTYGENGKSSRKNIKLGKQRRHMDERRTVGEVLGRLKGCVHEDEATDAESIAKAERLIANGEDSRKSPMLPSGSRWRIKNLGRFQSSSPPKNTEVCASALD